MAFPIFVSLVNKQPMRRDAQLAYVTGLFKWQTAASLVNTGARIR